MSLGMDNYLYNPCIKSNQDISTLEIHFLPISAGRLSHKNTKPPALHIRLSLLEVSLRGSSIAPDFKNISLKTLQAAIFVHL
jgi:hypothetical protein